MIRKHNAGLSIIEIIVASIIIGLLSAIALPMLYSWIDRSRSVSAISLLTTIDYPANINALSRIL